MMGYLRMVRGAHVMPWEANAVAVKLAEAWCVSHNDASTVLKANGLSLMALLRV